jgi:hypothetical protein
MVIASLLLAFAGQCFGQAGLAIRNVDGSFVGWLLGKFPYEISDPVAPTLHFRGVQILTRQGYILTLTSSYYFHASSRLLVHQPPSQLLFESSTCDSQAYVAKSYIGFSGGGDIFQVGGGESDVFFAASWDTTTHEPSVKYKKGGDGKCLLARSEHLNPPYVRVIEIDPSSIGLRWFSGPGAWGLSPAPTMELQIPDTTFCNGFESCPTFE